MNELLSACTASTVVHADTERRRDLTCVAVDARVIARFESTLPADDDHPYRTGPWRPNLTEWHVRDCDVVGELPADLDGIYLRNTENPLHPALGRYHPFDGDGMLHAVEFGNGTASYRNRFVRTAGFEAELAAGGPLWAGSAEPPSRSLRDGWGARTRMKDASSHRRRRPRRSRPHQLLPVRRPLRPSTRSRSSSTVRCAGTDWFPAAGVSAHPKVDPTTGELLFFNYATSAPYLHYGVADADQHARPLHADRAARPPAASRHGVHRALRHPQRLPAVLGSRPARRGIHAVRFFPDLPTRIGVLPRHGGDDEIRWFEATPTYVLHWINAYEDGDEWSCSTASSSATPQLAMRRPTPADPTSGDVPLPRRHRARPVPYRWRLDLTTGAVKEEFLSDRISEFGTINADHLGRPYRYCYSLPPEPGWFLFNGLRRTDVETGTTVRVPLRRRRLRQRGAAGAPRRSDGRGRRLRRHHHDGHRRRPLRMPRLRRRRPHRRTAGARAAAGTGLLRHAQLLDAARRGALSQCMRKS